MALVAGLAWALGLPPVCQQRLWGEEPAAQVVDDASNQPGNSFWFVSVDAQWMARADAQHSQTLVTSTPVGSTSRVNLLGTDDLALGPGIQPEFALGYQLNAAWSLEVGYFGIGGVSQNGGVTGPPGTLSAPFTSSAYDHDFTNADRLTAHYDSSIQNLELNVGHLLTPGLTGLVGVRYVNLDEHFNLHAVNGPGAGSSYAIRSDNQLLGLQIGGDEVIPLSDHWTLTALGRLGAFNNESGYGDFLGDNNNTTTLRDTSNHASSFAWIGEIGISLYYHVSNRWQAWIGYRVDYIDDVYLAPDQLDFTTGPNAGTTAQHQGSLLYHGPRIGLNFIFP